MSLGEMLKLARDRCGLTLNEASAATGIGLSSISEFENDKREPKMSLLSKFASVYRQPLAFFFDPAHIANTDVVLWREEPESSLASNVEATFLRLCEQYHNLESWCRALPDTVLPTSSEQSDAFGYTQAQALASRVRKEFVLGDHPGPALKTVLEEVYAVKIFYLRFEPTGCAACTVSSKFGPAILLNSNNAPWRRTYDLAHELFHILTWSVFRNGADGTVTKPNDLEEKYANSFASHLLLPTEAVENSINAVLTDGKAGTNDIANIAREYDVSVDALIWRLHSLYRWEDKDATKDIIARVKQDTSQRNWSASDSEKLPERYAALAVQALNAGHISTGKFAEYMGLSRMDAESYVTLEAMDDDQIEVTSS
jgi:Zn-dependent peptidase ImmA (M78 family)/transcriptional regulator with XRE-family HTH domain